MSFAFNILLKFLKYFKFIRVLLFNMLQNSCETKIDVLGKNCLRQLVTVVFLMLQYICTNVLLYLRLIYMLVSISL